MPQQKQKQGVSKKHEELEEARKKKKHYGRFGSDGCGQLQLRRSAVYILHIAYFLPFRVHLISSTYGLSLHLSIYLFISIWSPLISSDLFNLHFTFVQNPIPIHRPFQLISPVIILIVSRDFSSSLLLPTYIRCSAAYASHHMPHTYMQGRTRIILFCNCTIRNAIASD
jgi:hypothetical protein